MSEEFIREFQDKVDWDEISRYQKLTEEFIKEFKDKVNWFWISYNQKLSEEFIREFQDKLDWTEISGNQKLSEDFIREFQDKVDWTEISTYQKLSESFIGEFNLDYNLLNIVHYCGNENRKIYITKDQPALINIGCFKGTKEEAIEAISSKYKGKAKKKYIKKVNECFNF